MDLMVSMFLMPVMVTPWRRASVSSEPLALFFMLLAVMRITTTSSTMESNTTRPSFQLYISSSQAHMSGRSIRTSAYEKWSMAAPMFLMLE